jgi:methylmalonyl-CoA/ethylmalonyl-CoA epimerase
VQVSEPTLHHVGYAVRSIADSLPRWQDSLAPVAVSETFEDPAQSARVIFLEFAPGSTLLELVEPLGADTPLARFLSKGGGLHHLCFEVDDLDAHIREMQGKKAFLVRHPRPAVAFGGRRITWMITREKLLVEYLERAA